MSLIFLFLFFIGLIAFFFYILFTYTFYLVISIVGLIISWSIFKKIMRLRFNMKLKKSWIEVLDNILNNLAYYENEYTIFIPVQLKIQNGEINLNIFISNVKITWHIRLWFLAKGEQIAELIDIFYEKVFSCIFNFSVFTK